MHRILITVDVHCYRAEWAKNNPNTEYNDIRYRLYVDEDLLTERNWSWDERNFIRERIVVDVESRPYHRLTLVPVLKLPEQAMFKLSDFTVTNRDFVLKEAEPTMIGFKVYKYTTWTGNNEIKRIFKRIPSRQ